MAYLSDAFKADDTRQSIGRFAVVGMLGTVIDVGLFALLHTALGLPTLAANTISYSAGIVNNYLLHRHWTYAGRPRRAAGMQFLQFLAVSLSALLLNNLLVLLLARPLGTFFAAAGRGDLLAKGCATGVGMVWNYLANTLWTFRDTRKGV
jgi:putative flippase GtrA